MHILEGNQGYTGLSAQAQQLAWVVKVVLAPVSKGPLISCETVIE